MTIAPEWSVFMVRSRGLMPPQGKSPLPWSLFTSNLLEMFFDILNVNVFPPCLLALTASLCCLLFVWHDLWFWQYRQLFFFLLFSLLLSAGKKLNVAVTPAASEPRLPHKNGFPPVDEKMYLSKKKRKRRSIWEPKSCGRIKNKWVYECGWKKGCVDN